TCDSWAEQAVPKRLNQLAPLAPRDHEAQQQLRQLKSLFVAETCVDPFIVGSYHNALAESVSPVITCSASK
ncbi:MAG TPA: hypothetical protein VJQ54_13450, partial [Candidatus Sulfotelmatobacter sp.]|nr:hypothetical protein [Candidatus Sulfotelmatobacter sp.]